MLLWLLYTESTDLQVGYEHHRRRRAADYGRANMNRREQIVRYVMENGPCSDESIYLNVAKVGVMQMRRMLVRGCPEGMIAYEKRSGNSYRFVVATRPPTDFFPISIQRRSPRNPQVLGVAGEEARLELQYLKAKRDRIASDLRLAAELIRDDSWIPDLDPLPKLPTVGQLIELFEDMHAACVASGPPSATANVEDSHV